MRRSFATVLGLLVLALSSVATMPPQQARAATCTVTSTANGRPYIAPTASGPGTGKKVGFDNTHGETAGSADWVINGGFGDMACALAGQGYSVEEIRTYPLTTSALSAYDVAVFPEPNIPFTTAEEQAIAGFVSAGHGLMLIGDHYQADRNYNTWDATEVFSGWRRGHYQATYSSPYYWYNGVATSSTYTFNNEDDWLATNFGFRFHFSALDLANTAVPFSAGNLSDPDDPGILAPADAFNITSGVSGVSLHAGSTMSIVDPAVALGVVYPNKNSIKRWSSAQSNDPIAVYTDNVGTAACGSATYGGRCEGPFVVVAKPSAGKVAAIGDSSTWESSSPKYKREDNGGTKTTYAGWSEFDNATLGINLVNWLATPDATVGIPSSMQQQSSPEPYNVFTISEPLAEPWSTGTAGYYWYDARTFAAGSYANSTAYGGGGSGDTQAPTVSITAPSSGATVSGTTAVTASASDNVGVSRVEFYLDGGLQATDTSSPYSWSWDTTAASNGSHSLTAKAYDAAGNVGTSSAVSVTVSNTSSTISASDTFTGTLNSTTTTKDFWIDVSATGTINLQLTWGATASFNLYLYNPSGTQVANVQGKGSGESITYNATATGQYKLHVTRSSGSSDFALAASYPINSGVTAALNQSGTLSSGGTQNFPISVGASGTVNMSLSYPSGTSFRLYLLNSSGSTVASSTSSTLNPQSISYKVSGAGSYTVRVQAYSGSGSFTLSGYYPK